jgi:RimJ/RimL family protein N-acetyltransferase
MEKGKLTNPFLIGEKTYLRSVEPGDEIIIAESENHPDARGSLYYALPSSTEIQLSRLEQKVQDHSTIFFTICTKNPNVPIGCTSFVRIDWVGRMATFYIAIAAKENWSQGYGTEATKLMVDYGFETLGMNRIQLHVSAENERAVKVYEKTGFIKEGKLRQAMFYDNHFIDFFLMSILREEWVKIKNK